MFNLRGVRGVLLVAIATFFIGPGSQVANAQSLDELNDLNRQIEGFYQTGSYKRALNIAEYARSLANDGTPRGRINQIRQLERLAAINRALGDILAAKGHRKQAGKLIKRHFPSNRAKYAMGVNNRAGVSLTQGYKNITGNFVHARATLSGRYGNDHWMVGIALNNAAEALKAEKRYQDAEKYSKQAIEVLTRSLNPGDIRLITAMLNRSVLLRLLKQGPSSRIIRSDAHDQIKKHWRKEEPGAASALDHAATLYMAIDPKGLWEVMREYSVRPQRDNMPIDFSEAGFKLVERQFGVDHPKTMATATRLAAVYRVNGRREAEEALYLRVLATLKKMPGIENVEIASAHEDLAGYFRRQGRQLEAAIALNNALAIYEKLLPSNAPETNRLLNNLGGLYQERGQTKDAKATFVRVLKLLEQNATRRNTEDRSVVLGNLATINQKLGNPAKAEEYYKRALGLLVEPGSKRQSVLASLTRVALANHYTKQNKLDAAEDHFKKALAELELSRTAYDGRRMNTPHLDIPIADTLRHYAALDAKRMRIETAKSRYQSTLPLYKKHLHANHSIFSTIAIKIGELYAAQNNWPHAVRYYSDGTDKIKKRLRGRWSTKSDVGASQITPNEVAREIEYFKALVKINYQRITEIRGQGKTASEIDSNYQTMQWGLSSKAAASLQKMAARGAVGNTKFAQEMRLRQDLTREWQILSTALLKALALPAERRNSENFGGLKDAIAKIDRQLKSVNPVVAKELARVNSLSTPEPFSIAHTQNYLRAKEALVFIVDTSVSLGISEETFIWVVTKNDARWVRSPMGTKTMQREVSLLRCGLDPTLWNNYPTVMNQDSRDVKQTKIARQKQMENCLDAYPHNEGANGLLPFDLDRAHKLYKSLFGEVEDLIKGKDLFIVPAGPLTQLPFQVLLTKKPDPALSGTASMREAAWLARDHAISVLPAVSSLKALRALAKTSKAEKSFIGFGNPLLNGRQYNQKHAKRAALARAITSCKILTTEDVRTRLAALGSATLLGGNTASQSQSGDLASVRRQIPVPETASQLCVIARETDPGGTDVYLGADASEEKLKILNKDGKLAQYKVIQFATHGLLAGELNANSEPGLILTPPVGKKTLENDDGFLSASEIIGLKLNADWVVLSACNTAAGGTKSAEALSGLARAFFYAGARAMLVSHWSNYSNSTNQLVSDAVTGAAKIGRAKALQTAMLKMIDNGAAPRWAHPTYWAPFILVGERGGQ